MSTRLGSHLRANFVGYAALFLTLTMGTAWAAGLKPNSVGSKQLKPGAVKQPDLAADAVDSSKVIGDSLTGTDIDEARLDAGALPRGPAGPAGPVGADGATGPQGPIGPPGSPDTPAQVLDKLLQVDGSGSGLDADRLDGLGSADVVKAGEAAGGDFAGSTFPDPEIAADAVGGAEIADATRSVNLPLGAFVNVSEPAAIDAAEADDNAPDFSVPSGHLTIRWDDDLDGGDPDVPDTDHVGATFTVPPDYASGGELHLFASKATHTGNAERFDCNQKLNGTGSSVATTVQLNQAEGREYIAVMSPPSGYAAGDAVGIRCGISAPPGVPDDSVFLHAAEWRYQAGQ
jgi:hypothetical protein